MKIRAKIMLGFLILSVMLAVAGAYSIYELNTISASVQALLDDNYKSVNAAKHMIEALEREDSGVLLLLSHKWKEGRSTISDADKKFAGAFDAAIRNITIANEKSHIDAIHEKYTKYQKHWDQPIIGTEYEGNLNWYFEQVHKDFIDVKAAVEDLMALNDRAMYETASMLKNRAQRVIMPGIVAVASALIFALIFSFFINLYVVNPILTITSNVKGFLQNREPVRVEVDTRDELYDLAISIQDITRMIQDEK